MSLVKVDSTTDLESAISQWRYREPSRISHHGSDCCTNAQLWLTALDRSRRGAGSTLSGPKWVLEQFPWGPNEWPIHWCELVEAETLDCGSLADLTCNLFRARGVPCESVQLIFQFSEADVRHWSSTWLEASREPNWIVGSLAYHEACAVFVDATTIRVWDPTDNCWIMLAATGGYGKPLAVRVAAEGSRLKQSLIWEGHQLAWGLWHRFD